MSYLWQTTNNPNYTANIATKKFGGYDPKQYEYQWDGAYLNRTKKATPPQELETEAQKQGKISLQGLLSNPATYNNPLTAENAYSGQIDQKLQSYLNRTNPESLNLAEQQLQKTLSQDFYDPNTSQFYQGVRDSAQLNLNDALNQQARRGMLTGTLRSTGQDIGRARLLAENTANLNQVLGTLANQERQNQLGAVNQAQNLAGFLSQEQANSLGALTSTSDYLTQLRQKQLDAEYQEWLRQQNEKIDLSKYLYSTPATYMFS